MNAPFLFLAILLSFARPNAPVILEPQTDGQVVSGADVHMVTAPFTDPDGHAHRCTDWEIVREEQVVWQAPCAEGPQSIHIHLGDGAFVGTLSGERELEGDADYRLRVRHRDDSGDAETEWSDWSERTFRTAVPPANRPMRLRDVLATEAIDWNAAPPAGASLRLELIDRVPLLELRDGGVLDEAPVGHRSPIRLVLRAGREPWVQPASELSFDDENGDRRTIYLPAVDLAADAQTELWVADNGGTHRVTSGAAVPVFDEVARPAPIPWTVERGFVVEPFATGFRLPVGIAFIPDAGEEPDDAFFYVAELYGDVKVVTRAGEVHDFATGLLDFDPTGAIPGSGESGIGGITVDPQTGDVYITRVSWPDRSNRTLVPEVVRLQATDDHLRVRTVQTILTLPDEPQSASHQISHVSIGPDRKLYVHFGDSVRHDLAQDLAYVRGKIIRINFDGSAPEDNPFYDASDGLTAKDLIFASGFRNPFGGAWRAADQSLYELENGPTIDRLARVVAGRNYGWDGDDASMRNYALATWTAPAAPVALTFVERQTFDGSAFPARKLGSAFVTESGPTWGSAEQPVGKVISEVVLAGETLVRRSTFARYTGSGKATAAGIAAGPDGLYFSDLYKDAFYETPTDRGANVFRIRWTGYADFEPRTVTRDGLTLDFADRSDAPAITTYEWDFGDGTSSSEPHPRHTYARPGTYIVRLTVNGTLVETKKMRAGAPREDVAVDFQWGEVAPFTSSWSGTLRPRFSETYRFTIETDGVARLFIDGTRVEGAVELEADRDYAFLVEYEHVSGSAALRVTWESASQRSLAIPQTVSFPRRRAVR